MKYLQCEITKVKDKTSQITWLPEIYAKQGAYIKLQTEDGIWDNGWLVTCVYRKIDFDEKELNERSQDYKKQRKASDI